MVHSGSPHSHHPLESQQCYITKRDETGVIRYRRYRLFMNFNTLSGLDPIPPLCLCDMLY